MCIISCFLNTSSIVLFYLWIQLWWERCYEAVWMDSWNCLLWVLKVSECLEFGVQTRTVDSTENLCENVELFSALKWKVTFWVWALRCMNQQNSVVTVTQTHCFCPVEIQQDLKALRSGAHPTNFSIWICYQSDLTHSWWNRRLNFYLQSPYMNDVAEEFWW